MIYGFTHNMWNVGPINANEIMKHFLKLYAKVFVTVQWIKYFQMQTEWVMFIFALKINENVGHTIHKKTGLEISC